MLVMLLTALHRAGVMTIAAKAAKNENNRWFATSDEHACSKRQSRLACAAAVAKASVPALSNWRQLDDVSLSTCTGFSDMSHSSASVVGTISSRSRYSSSPQEFDISTEDLDEEEASYFPDGLSIQNLAG